MLGVATSWYSALEVVVGCFLIGIPEAITSLYCSNFYWIVLKNAGSPVVWGGTPMREITVKEIDWL